LPEEGVFPLGSAGLNLSKGNLWPFLGRSHYPCQVANPRIYTNNAALQTRIAKYVAVRRERDERMKAIVAAAARHFGVTEGAATAATPPYRKKAQVQKVALLGNGAGPCRVLTNVIQVRFRYRGLLGARNCDLIQPLNWSLSTCTQSPSRFVAVKLMPLGAFPTTVAFVEGANLIFTPGRCKKTVSGFCDKETVGRGVSVLLGAAGATFEVSVVREAGRSGQATATDGSGEISGLLEAV
jgi:hypothetical protein